MKRWSSGDQILPLTLLLSYVFKMYWCNPKIDTFIFSLDCWVGGLFVYLPSDAELANGARYKSVTGSSRHPRYWRFKTREMDLKGMGSRLAHNSQITKTFSPPTQRWASMNWRDISQLLVSLCPTTHTHTHTQCTSNKFAPVSQTAALTTSSLRLFIFTYILKNWRRDRLIFHKHERDQKRRGTSDHRQKSSWR